MQWKLNLKNIPVRYTDGSLVILPGHFFVWFRKCLPDVLYTIGNIFNSQLENLSFEIADAYQSLLLFHCRGYK